MLIAICDDQEKDCNLLKAYCLQYELLFRIPMEVLLFQNAGELLQSKKARTADAILLDIYMDGASGMDAAHILRNKGFQGAIIFATSSKEHFAEGYEVEAIHYLLKPISWNAFQEAIRRVISRQQKDSSFIHVNTGGITLDIATDHICYIEVLGRKTIIHTDKNTLTVRESLTTLETMLDGDPFLRCYRYFIINMDQVLRLLEDGFLMHDQQIIPISRDGRREIRRHYLSYIFKKAEVNN